MPVAIPLALGAAAAGAGAAAGAAAAATTLTFLGIGAWGWTAIAIGLSLAGTLAQTLMQPTPPKPKMQEGDVSVRQAIPPRTRLYGRARLGGTYLYYDSTPDGDLKHLLCHCAHEIDDSTEGFPNPEEDWLNDDRVQLNEDGEVLDDPWWQDEGFGDGFSTVVIQHYLGSPTQSIPSFDPAWTAAHHAHGLNCAYIKYSDLKDEDQIRVFPSGFPPYRAVLRGAKIFDPRLAGTDPGEHDPADEATWTWSDNAALAVLDFLTRLENGVPVGFGIPFTRINMDSFAEAAAICDQLLPLKAGGTEKRWRCWGAYELTENRKDVLQDLLDACGGRISQGPDGKIGLVAGAGRYRATGGATEWTVPAGVPVAAVVLDEDQLYGWNLTNGKTALERVNEVRATYVSQAWEWAETEAGIQTDDDGIARNGTESAQIKLRFVPAESQAQRCARETLKRGNPTWSGSVRSTLAGLDAWGERWIRLQIAELEIDGIFEIDGISLDRETMMVEIKVNSYDAWWDWTASDDEKDPAIPPPDVDDDDEIPVPENVTVTIESRLVNAQTYVAVGVIHWDPPPRSVYVARARYRPVILPVQPWQPLPVAQDDLQVETGPLIDGQLYEAQVRFIGSRGGGGDWSASANFTAVADPVPPPAPTDLTAQVNVPTTGKITVTATAPNSPKHASLRFYRNTTNTFVGATLIAGPLYGGPGAERSTIDDPGVGDWYYFATSANWSNVESTPAGGVLAEVAPVAPTITSPTNPTTTNDNRLPVVGTGINGATIKLYANAVQVGTGTVSGGGWTVVPSSPYGNGVNSLTATQTIGGNESPASGSVALTVNTLDTDARAYIDAMSVRPSSARMGDINTLVLALKTAGVWTKTDCLYLLAAHDEQASRLNLKAPGSFVLTAVSAPVFTADRGWKGTGSGATVGGYLSTGFNPATAGGVLALNSAHLGVWIRTAATTSVNLTMAEAGNTALRIFSRSATAGSGNARSNNAVDTAAAWGADTLFLLTSRAASTSYDRYRNTTSIGSAAVVSVAVASAEIFLLRSSAGTHSDAQISAAVWGSALTATEAGDLYNALHTYLVAVGAAV